MSIFTGLVPIGSIPAETPAHRISYYRRRAAQAIEGAAKSPSANLRDAYLSLAIVLHELAKKTELRLLTGR